MYISTRGLDVKQASKAIIQGLATDGGLFIIDKLPEVNFDESWLNLSYKEVAFKILRLFLEDFTDDEILYAINSAYSKENFPNGEVGFDLKEEFGFLNLYNGPTFAFKDMALTILPYLLDISKKKNNIEEKTVILTATSGDTGSAALSGFKQISGNSVVVLYPNNAVSKIQEAQMLSFKASNTYPIAVNGNFDDCQRAVKEIFSKVKVDGISLSSANSINIGRLVPQIVYYFYSYITLVNGNKIKFGEKINVSVPTGNFGNILACYISKLCGLYIDRIICASNENNVLTEFFETGVYNANKQFKVTNSPSMDILVSSNLERYLYLNCKDTFYINKLMTDLKQNGYYEVNDELKLKLKDMMASYVSEKETEDAISKCYKEHNILIDPHTAVAYQAYLNKKEELAGYTLVVSTASPYKFSKTIKESLSISNVDDEFEDISNIESITKWPVDERILDLKNQSNKKNVWGKEDILNNVLDILGKISC